MVLVALVAAAAAAPRPGGPPFAYVALGDSFSAGEGVDPYLRRSGAETGLPSALDNRCHRSSRAYATWVKRQGDAETIYALASGGGRPGRFGGTNKYGSERNVRVSNGVRWASWACSGATTKNVLPRALGGAPQRGVGESYDRRTQLDSADLAGADLVTITLGGNDAGFAEVLFLCAVSNCATEAFRRAWSKTIDETRQLLEQVYRAIARRAPRARILVLGYPLVFPATEAEQSCRSLRWFSGEQNMLRGLGAHLNTTIEAAVKALAKSGAKIEWVPVADRFAGHEVCGRSGAWLNGLSITATWKRVPINSRSFHPTLEGHQRGYAAAVNAALRGRR